MKGTRGIDSSQAREGTGMGNLKTRLSAMLSRQGLRSALSRVGPDLAVWADVRAFPPLAVLVALNCVAAMAALRPYAGGPALKLTNSRLCIAAVSASLLALAARWWLSRIESQPPAGWLRGLLAVSSILPALALLTAVNERHSNWAVAALSACGVATAAAMLGWKRRVAASAAVDASGQRPVTPIEPTPFVQPERIKVSLVSSPNPVPLPGSRRDPAPLAHETRVPGSVADDSQNLAWLRRTRDAAGREHVSGVLVASFAENQSTATLHVPFCPPFELVPEFESEIVATPSVRIKATAVFAYGARLELKRSAEIDAPLDAQVRFHATAARLSARAA